VTVLTWPGPDDLRGRAGQCYTLAFETVLLNLHVPELYLVHGLLHPDRSAMALTWAGDHPEIPLPPVNPHAWIEVGEDIVADPVARQLHSIAEHRRLYGAEVIRRYRADVALSIAARRDTAGPWDRTSLTAWEERQAAARADPRFTQQAALDRFFT
jgi:hypothetical protein